MMVTDNIPSSHTPMDDISGLIPRGFKTRSDINVLEAENMRKAVLVYLAAKPTRRQAPFSLPWMYKLHRQMFGEVWRWAGKRRCSELNLGVPVHQIDTELQTMLDNLAYWHENADMNLLEQSARLHHRAVSIHPFLNGNGRWSRLLSNIWLRLNGHPITVWPEEHVGSTSVIRDTYLSAIRAADFGDFTALLALHRRYTSTSGDSRINNAIL